MTDVHNVFHHLGMVDVRRDADRVTGGDPDDLDRRAAACGQAGAGLVEAADDTDAIARVVFRQWSGEAADAARRALVLDADQRREQAAQLSASATAFDAVAAALRRVQAVARDCTTRADAADRELARILATAQDIVQAATPVLSGVSWVVEKATGVDVEQEVTSFLTAALGDLRNVATGLLVTMITALHDYEDVLRQQAGVLRAMPGVVRLDAGPVDLPGDADLRRGALFRSVYGRDPHSAADLLMARALDAQGSDAGDTRQNANVTVLRIEPVPGGGIVHGAAFLAEDDVLNPLYPTGDLGTLRNHGDNRGFDRSADPDRARMSFDIDYETGVVVVRQNASVTNSGESVTGYPDVGLEQDAQGRVRLRVEGTDPFADPVAGWAGTTVRGDLVVDPHGGSSTAEVSGKVSQYPSWEVYQDRGGQTGATLLQQAEPRTLLGDQTGTGPGLFLGRPTHPVGPDPSALPDWLAAHHPDQHARSPLPGIIQDLYGVPVGSKLTDDFYDFPLHEQPYPTVDSTGRLTLPRADQVR